MEIRLQGKLYVKNVHWIWMQRSLSFKKSISSDVSFKGDAKFLKYAWCGNF